MSSLSKKSNWNEVSANNHVTDFIEKHKGEILPLPFFSKNVTQSVFFSSIEEYFTEKQCLDLGMHHIVFLGQAITKENSFFQSDALLGKKIQNLKKKYSVTVTQIHCYITMRRIFHRMKVGERIDVNLLNFYAYSLNLKVVVDTNADFFNSQYRAVLYKNQLVYQYHLTHFLLWAKQNTPKNFCI